MAEGRLFGVSVGPGDPELLTLKALRVLQEADVVAYPCTERGTSTALGIAAEHVAGKPQLRCLMPMTRDARALARAHAKAADDICARLSQGLDVAYLCLGDASVYASFGYLRDEVRKRGYQTETIPGVTSFCAAAARLQQPLCEDDGRLVIASARDERLDEVLDLPATKVLMKPGRSLQPLRAALENHGMLDKAHTVTRCGYGDEQVHDGVPTDASGYFSLVIVDE
jgi:precorrin-2/cobalt-factor-2 C20-methyltransferase